MKILGYILMVWLACLAVGAFFGILGKVIWFAVLVTVILGIWKYVEDK